MNVGKTWKRPNGEKKAVSELVRLRLQKELADQKKPLGQVIASLIVLFSDIYKKESKMFAVLVKM